MASSCLKKAIISARLGAVFDKTDIWEFGPIKLISTHRFHYPESVYCSLSSFKLALLQRRYHSEKLRQVLSFQLYYR